MTQAGPRVGVHAWLVPNGLLPDASGARGVVVLSPCAVDSNDDFAGLLEDWPQYAHLALDTLTGVTLSPRDDADHRILLRLRPAGWPLNNDDRDHVTALWKRLMAPCGSPDWPAIYEVWCRQKAAATREARPVLPMPTAEAGIALPLERARLALETIAPPESPLLARVPVRPSPQDLAALGRPWLGRPDALARFASARPEVLSDAASAALFGPPSPFDWAEEQRRSGTDTVLSARIGPAGAFYGATLDPDAIAASAIGTGGMDLLDIFDRMHALHDAGLIAVAAAAGQQPDSNEATSRLLHLQATPSLLRLFGLARDVIIDIQDAGLKGPAPQYMTFGELRTTTGALHTRSTAAKLIPPTPDKPASFCPVSRQEWKGAPNDALAQRDGLVNLGLRKDGKARYCLITIEPALALAADKHYEAVCQTSGDGVLVQPPSLRSGGLSLVRLDEPENEASHPDADPRFAEDLQLFQRLDIGLDTDEGIVWCCAMHRLLTLRDPSPPRGKTHDWIGHAIDRLLGAEVGKRRYELNAAHVVDDARLSGGNSIDIQDRRVATWTGEPAGVAIDEAGHARPSSLDGTRCIALDHHVTLPTEPEQALLLPLRFGWRYRIGLRKVFHGGVAIPIAEAGAAYDRTAACLPPPGEKGRRFLRHEPVAAPMAMLAPDVPDRKTGYDAALQSPERLVLISWRAKAPPRRGPVVQTARVLMVPPVPLEFAALHEAFDGDRSVSTWVPRSDDPAKLVPGKRPPDGLPMLDLSKILPPPPKQSEPKMPPPARLAFWPLEDGEQKRPVPYYPDPAAAFLVLALRRHDRPDDWFDETPLLIPMFGDARQGGAWPNAIAVHVELVTAPDRPHSQGPSGSAVATSRVRRLSSQERALTSFWLDRQGRLQDQQTPGALPVRTVTVSLASGEQAVLDAWFVPTIEDLAAWFDVAESAEILATKEGLAIGGATPDTACRTGLDSLLGTCGPGTIGDDNVGLIAARFHQHMLQRPLHQISFVRSLELVHAVDLPVHPPTLIDAMPGRLAVARRLDVTEPALRQFLAESGPPEDWRFAATQDGATEPVFGGSMILEPASTQGILLQVTAAGASGAPLDDPTRAPDPAVVEEQELPFGFVVDENGKVDFPRQTVNALRIEGIPEPEQGLQGSFAFSLQALQADAADERRRDRLRVQRFSVFADGGARLLKVSVVALGRHTSRLFYVQDKHAMDGTLPARRTSECWLPATRRPAPPDVHSLVPAFRWSGGAMPRAPGGFLWWIERRTMLRLYLRRPWFGSGEGERVGIVLWPPGGSGDSIDTLSADFIASLVEDDLGPSGRFVSAWGRDPLRAWDDQAKEQSIFLTRSAFQDTGDPQDWQPRVLMPVPGAEVGANPESFAQVSLLTYEPRFDVSEHLWFVDLDVNVGELPDPFIRLGIVRYQPNAREDRPLASEGIKAIRCSAPVAAWIQALPRRHLSATCTPLAAPHVKTPFTQLAVTLAGPGGERPTDGKLLPHTAVRVRVVRHRPEAAGRPAEETDVYDHEGRPLRWESWSGAPHGDMRRAGGGMVWTCIFPLPQNLAENDWRYAVLAEEFDRMPSVYQSAGALHLQDGGARFVGRLELTPSAAPPLGG